MAAATTTPKKTPPKGFTVTKRAVFKFTDKDLDEAVCTLLQKEPFYYYLLVRLARHRDVDFPAWMAVATRDLVTYELIYNPEYGIKTSAAEDLAKALRELAGGAPLPDLTFPHDLVCMLKHEILHLVLRHCVDPRCRKDGSNWNLATDCAINQMIGWSEGAKEHFIFPATLSKMLEEWCGEPVAVPDKMDAVTYYEIIRKHSPKSPSMGGEGADPGPDGGKSGEGEGSASDRVAKEIAKGHAKWKELSPDQRDFVEENLKRLVKEARDQSEAAGMGAGDSGMILDTFPPAPALNWRQLIRRTVSADVSDLEDTFKRPDRRRRDMFPGKRRTETVDFIWGADTSGSLYGRPAFERVLNEIKKTLRQFGRRDVRFIQIDSKIHRDEVVRSNQLGKVKFSGGGGTAMGPVFAKLAKERNRLPFILFTDGEWFGKVDWSKVRFQVLVLLTENGTDRYVKDAPANVRTVRVITKKTT